MLPRIKFSLIRPEASVEYVKPILGRLYGAYCWLRLIKFKIYKLKFKGGYYYFPVLIIPKFRGD
ncbi:hypothetical protein [Intestinibacter bartlettii]|uniref:hypothetical protein n=1 Tax=Intestinibacter bartlettii TaxID=261299 RepID=UPI0008213F00|nr:hypothetical protein [Intestinibacter bartlettii]SCJ11696.1 Uncharacterised protein [uncultured Clostridium sp.]